jgi:hypothetical protein
MASLYAQAKTSLPQYLQVMRATAHLPLICAGLPQIGQGMSSFSRD